MSFHAQLGGQVKVDVEASASVNLNVAIEDIRDQYETLVAKNRKDVEAWFKNKVGCPDTAPDDICI